MNVINNNYCDFFGSSIKNTTPITPIVTDDFGSWLKQQPAKIKTWLEANNFTAKAGSYCYIPDSSGNGKIAEVLLGIENSEDVSVFGQLPNILKQGTWHINANKWPTKKITKAAIAWALGAYRFNQYKKSDKQSTAKLFLPKNCDIKYIENVVNTTFLVRDLINQPAESLGPEQLAKTAMAIAKQHKVKQITQISGNSLLQQNYPLVHLVGRASNRAPRLVEFTWGNAKNPKLAIIGKGICFDSGGLDIKPTAAMDKMKKDMAGAAHALGLANMIMTAKLPVHLHVILPIAENLVSASSMKPGDIIKARNGKTVEIINTDAEGRLILADALTRASEKEPDLIIDIATLTGAATVALGPEIISMFTNDDKLANDIAKSFAQEQELIWHMPLHKPYRALLNSRLADIMNCSTSGYAGSITAALFLQEFITSNISWVHLDLHGSNVKTRPGHPQGGEAMGLQGLFAYISNYFTKNNIKKTK